MNASLTEFDIGALEMKDVDATSIETSSAVTTPNGNATGAPDLSSAVTNRLFGDIISLLVQSPAHKFLFLADLEWLVGPPLALRQFQGVYDGKRIIGFASWAYVSDECDEELKRARRKLKPSEWNSGQNMWIIEVVAAPGANQPNIAKQLISKLAERARKDRLLKMWAYDKAGKPKVVTFASKRTAAADG